MFKEEEHCEDDKIGGGVRACEHHHEDLVKDFLVRINLAVLADGFIDNGLENCLWLPLFPLLDPILSNSLDFVFEV